MQFGEPTVVAGDADDGCTGLCQGDGYAAPQSPAGARDECCGPWKLVR